MNTLFKPSNKSDVLVLRSPKVNVDIPKQERIVNFVSGDIRAPLQMFQVVFCSFAIEAL